MFRELTACVALAAVVAGGIELEACGDKFFRVGRGPRSVKYAAAYPAKILIYRPAGAKNNFVKDLETMLRRAGHKPTVAPQGTPAERVSSAAFDVVIASYGDALRLRDELRPAAAKPEVLPIVKEDLAAEGQRHFSHVLIAGVMTAPQALAEIDRLMAQRSSHAVSSTPATGG